MKKVFLRGVPSTYGRVSPNEIIFKTGLIYSRPILDFYLVGSQLPKLAYQHTRTINYETGTIDCQYDETISENQSLKTVTESHNYVTNKQDTEQKLCEDCNSTGKFQPEVLFS